jgi:stage V sporulation protein G
MEITEIRIVLANDGSLRAFVTITLDNSLAIRDMKIIEGPKGLFVSMPSKKQSSLATNCLQTVLLR